MDDAVNDGAPSGDVVAIEGQPMPGAPEHEFPMELDEFCALLSKTDRRVELIAVFHHLERASGVARDTATNYRARYAAVATRPAK